MVRWSTIWPGKEKKFCTESKQEPMIPTSGQSKCLVLSTRVGNVSPWIWFFPSVAEFPDIQGPDTREVSWARCWVVCAGCNQLHNKIIIHSILVWSVQMWVHLSLWSYGRPCAVKHWGVSYRMLCLSSNWNSWHSLQQCLELSKLQTGQVLSPAVKLSGSPMPLQGKWTHI